MARRSGGRRPWHGAAAAAHGAGAREDGGPSWRAERGAEERIWSCRGPLVGEAGRRPWQIVLEGGNHGMGRRRLSAAPTLEKTADHGGARSEAETHGSGRSHVRSGRSGAPHRDPWAGQRLEIGIGGAGRRREMQARGGRKL